MRSMGGEQALEPTRVRIPTPLSAAVRPRPGRRSAGPWSRRLRRYGALVAGAQTVRSVDGPVEERVLFLAGISLATLSRIRHGSNPRLPRRPPSASRARSEEWSRSPGAAPRRAKLITGRHSPLVLGAVGAVALVLAALEFLAFCLGNEVYERWRQRRRRAGAS